MRRFITVLCACILLSVFNSTYTDSVAMSFSTDITEYVKDHFDEIYPGVSDEAKRWLSYNAYSQKGSVYDPDGETWYISLSYKGEETISVRIWLKITAFPIEIQVIDHTPWNLAEIICLYECGISREEARRIAMAAYPDVAKKVCEERPEAAAQFLAEYGQDALEPEHIVLHSHWLSTLNGGSTHDVPYFRVYFTHEAEMSGPSMDWEYCWFAMDIDAKSGEIIQITDTDEFFMVRPYLFRDIIERWEYDR